jgi:hypothetical protein
MRKGLARDGLVLSFYNSVIRICFIHSFITVARFVNDALVRMSRHT